MQKFNGGVYFICFRLKMLPFFGKFGPKNRNCQFKLKIGNQTNLNMKNSIAIIFFCVFDQNCTFFLEMCSKIQNCLLKLKFRLQIKLNMQNSMVILIFLVRKYLFCVNLSQKFKKVILRRHLLPTLENLTGVFPPPLINFLIFFHPEHSFSSFLQVLSEINLAFWCCLINLSVFQLQRLETSHFPCYISKIKQSMYSPKSYVVHVIKLCNSY